MVEAINYCFLKVSTIIDTVDLVMNSFTDIYDTGIVAFQINRQYRFRFYERLMSK